MNISIKIYINVHNNLYLYRNKIYKYISHLYIYNTLLSKEYFSYCTVAIESKYFKRCKQNVKKMNPYNNGIFCDVTINSLKHSSVMTVSQVWAWHSISTLQWTCGGFVRVSYQSQHPSKESSRNWQRADIESSSSVHE